ncbi:MAG: pectin esterase [Marmoricola sp.]|nr:pectin esterase [Marmoricola sp.]
MVAASASVFVTTALLTVLPVAPVAAATNTLQLNVVSARTEPRASDGAGVHEGDAVSSYKFLINEDNTGSTEQRNATGACSPSASDYPASCNWPSIRELPHTTAPVVTQGTEADLANGLDLPDGKYLISVLADGYKLDGAHFSVPFVNTGSVTVELQPNPLPDSTIRAQIYADEAPTNGAIDNGEDGLAGFQGHANDTLGEVQTDVYGNPLCTTYVDENPDTHVIPNGSLDGDGLPQVEQVGGKCLSDSSGMLVIPHMGPNRYTVTAVAPGGSDWIQTTTLEGNHDWDTWMMEGSTGYDTEALVAGEPVPTTQFGFAKLKNNVPSGGGSISGVVVGVKQYTPPTGGDANFYNGLTGSKADKPIPNPVLSLADLEDGDQAIWVGRGAGDGSFTIPNVPDGNYTLTWWDEPQNYILGLVNVSVRNGQAVKLGQLPLNGWWTQYEGFVFNDQNGNGKRDPGEPGIPNFTLTMRRQENSLMDRGTTTVGTNANGHYSFEGAYPLASWTVLEAYDDRWHTTGVTYQADNQPTPTTVKGAGVDISTLNTIGLSGTIDWGVRPYNASGQNGIDPRNGGIVGSISYDTTRNELDPQYAASEDWQPGISDLPVKLYDTVPCGTNAGAPCDDNEILEVAPDGSYKKGRLLNTYVSEHWSRPTGCTARDVDGKPLVHGVDERVLTTNQETDGECISAILQSVQLGTYATDQGTPDANFGATVDGNYGFSDGCFTGELATDADGPTCSGTNGFEPLGAGDYLVSVDIPDDAWGKPMYRATGEEDINIGRGDQIIPQVPPPACAGAMHTVDLKGDSTDGYDPVVGDGTNGVPTGVTVPASSAVDNATFLDIGGSPYEGTPKRTCETKLVGLSNGKSIVPMFNLFTDVPIPSRLFGLVVDDINYSTDPRSTLYGEKPGVPFAPVGIYDFNNRLVQTVESDYNGYYETLLPSTDHINCPTPSGVCAGMYRFVGNDPGVPGRLNPNYNPRYRTIATEFEAMPGVTIPTDLAPTQVGSILASPTTGFDVAVSCPVDPVVPQLFSVSRPYVNGSGVFSIQGTGFGSTKGTGKVTLDGTSLPTTGWGATSISASIPAGTPTGPHTLRITADNGEQTVNGLTFHVLGTGYNPTVREVGPGHTFATIQNALDAAFASSADDLVVVFPKSATPGNPRGAYYENLVMASPVKLQGVGPGGFQGNSYVSGTVLDAGAFGGDTDLATAWFAKVGGLTWDGNQSVADGEAIYVLASQNATTAAGRARQFTSGYKAAVDGFDLRGGDQQGFPGNINDLTGQPTGLPPNIVTQGGAIFANAYVRNLQITNNVVENNGGAYGTIRFGTPDLTAPNTNQHNEGARISDNRIVSNAGTNLAGAIGLFTGSDGYDVSGNDICGNFSLEYGAGVSQYGYSPNGKIHHNRIYLNNSNDEGGGIMIAGQLPANPDDLSPGAGPVDIYANQIQANLANDDGGGIRFLMAGNFPMNVHDNMIVNNVSTHEGGGVGINDAPDVRVYNNTIMKNLTTATAVTSDGTPAPAGLSTSSNSDQLQATLPNGSPAFSKPKLFNNIFWDNRAGTRAGTTVTGIGLVGDSSPVDQWDLGVADATGVLSPTSSVVQQDAAEHTYTASGTNSSAAPQVVDTYDLSVAFQTWRQNPAFVDSTLVAVEAPPNQMGDYHLQDCPTSPACNLGVSAAEGVNAAATDIDDQARPALGGYDAGADEFGAAPATPPASSDLFFSTAGNTNPIGVTGTADDSDIYRWNGTVFSREWDATANGVSGLVNVDGFSRVDATHFYVSFTGLNVLPGAGVVQDEDVVYFNNGTWSLWFDGSAHGLTSSIDVGTFSVVGITLYFTTNNTAVPPGASGSGDNADVYRWNGASTYTRAVDATTAPYSLPNTGLATGTTNPDVDGLVFIDATHFYASFSNATTTVPGVGTVADEDVVYFNGTAWSMYFDGSGHGLDSSANLDLDAISFASGAQPPAAAPATPPFAPLYFSTAGAGAVPGVAGPYESADVYFGNGTGYSRVVDASSSGVSLSMLANVDGFDRVDATHFYVSFSGSTLLAGVGLVQDEDILYNNSGTWSLYFDGSAHGLGGNGNLDLDAISIVGGVVHFSTVGNVNPPGVGGTADDADVYSWNGTSYARVWDATANGLTAAANVDGYARTDATHFYVSFSGTTTTVPTLGAVQDEDVVFYNGATRSVYFDGTTQGLTADTQDVDAFDVP